MPREKMVGENLREAWMEVAFEHRTEPWSDTSDPSVDFDGFPPLSGSFIGVIP